MTSKRKPGELRTKKEAALAKHLKSRRELRLLAAFGTFDFDPGYDYKAERRKKRH